MSLYGDYIKSRENFHIVENKHGFASYLLGNDTCYVRDVYVDPKHRRSKVAWKIMDEVTEIARKHNIKLLTTTACVSTNYVEDSVKAILAYGFKFSSAHDNMLYFVKEI